jgi:cytoplasmic iron level regulating protein YaaA (DUF328/UPF0246 family)
MTHYRKMSYPELIREHQKLVKILGKSRTPAIKKLRHAQKKELEEYIADYNKIKKRKP